MRLALDQGGRSSRAIVFAPDGRIAAHARVAVATRRATGGIVEQPVQHEARERAAAERAPRIGVFAHPAQLRRAIVGRWRQTRQRAHAVCVERDVIEGRRRARIHP